MFRHADEHHLRRALSLAATRAGDTWPNPTVGAVLVKDGVVIAEGVHERAGEEHAEIAALRRAREAARGATLYVTLEPCHHHGRTPPCSHAVAEAGVARVVYAVTDTNPQLAGGGADWLRSRGIEIRGGLLGGIAWELNHPFFETDGGARAHLTLKLALSAEGRIARNRDPEDDPERRRITGPVAHRRVHRLRARSSVVLVGRRTAAWDRPRLDVRLGRPSRQPRAAVIDPALELRPEALPGAEGERPALVICDAAASAARGGELESRGHELLRVPSARHGGLEEEAILEALHERGLGQVLLEGGWATAERFLRRGLVDRLHLFRSPRRVGAEGPGPGEGWPGAEDGWEHYLTARRGEDLEIILRRAGAPRSPAETGHSVS